MVDTNGWRGNGHVPAPEAMTLPPHPPLKHYYAGELDRHGWVRAIFNRTAVDYDRIERMMALGSGPWYRRQALLRAGLQPGFEVLDVGTGTGLVAHEVLKIIGDPARLTGVDPSDGMLAQSGLPAEVKLLIGTAERLPIDQARYDFLSMGFALRHVSDLRAAFGEYYRVLKPGGRACILEITRPRSRLARLLLKLYMRVLVPLYARLFGRSHDTAALMRYYWDTIEACVPPAQVMQALADAGFTQVTRHVELGIFSEYVAVKPHAVG